MLFHWYERRRGHIFDLLLELSLFYMIGEEDDDSQSSRFVVQYFDCRIYSSGINLPVVSQKRKTRALWRNWYLLKNTRFLFDFYFNKHFWKRLYLFLHFHISLFFWNNYAIKNRESYTRVFVKKCLFLALFQHNGKHIVARLVPKLGSKDCSMNLATPPLTRWRFDRYIYPPAAILVL